MSSVKFLKSPVLPYLQGRVSRNTINSYRFRQIYNIKTIKMVEAQKFRIEQEMTNLVNELDRSHLRKMQGDMHRCAARCCDDQQTSLERVHGCIENCTGSLNQANNYVQNEINHFQNRLQRCVMDCNDSARDRLGPDPSQETVDKCTIAFEKCAVKCVDKNMGLIPSMLKTMKAVLASGKPPPARSE